MDPDRIPTEPTTDHEPSLETAVASDPSQAPTSTADGRRRRSGVSGAVVTFALVATFSAGIGVGGFVATVIGGTAATPNPASSPAPSAPTEFGLIREAWDTLHEQYVGRSDLDDQALIYGAIEGMTNAVGDTGHTDFMTPDEREARNDALSGSYVGIGVRLDLPEGGVPTVIEVFPGGPAASAGILDGDAIVAVDGRSTTGMTVEQVVDLVRGEAGTGIGITVRAAGTGPERTYDLVRADVPIQAVSWALVPGTTTVVIRIDQFSNGAGDALVRALDDARAAGAERLVLDLRRNPGGYVNEAVGVASQFLDGGVVYIERDADGDETPHPVTAGGVATDLPLVVLVDGSTASAAEIVSGALQDAGRARVIGETTYGTGTVLGEFVLSDGSALRIGTVEWLTPDGRRIWHEGIAPDVPLTQPDGATALGPDEIAALSPAEVGAIGDAQLVRALEAVSTEAIASN